MPTIDPRRYAAAMRVCAGYLTEELEAMPYRALQLRFEREALYAELTAQLDARAQQAERERDAAREALRETLEALTWLVRNAPDDYWIDWARTIELEARVDRARAALAARAAGVECKE